MADAGIPTCRNLTCRTLAHPGYADRGMGEACARTTLDAFRALPGAYARLVPRVRERPRRAVLTPLGGKPGPMVPLDVEMDSFLRKIEWTVALWEEVVRERAGRPDRPFRSVAEAC